MLRSSGRETNASGRESLGIGRQARQKSNQRIAWEKRRSEKEIEDFRNIVRKTESLEYSQDLAKKYVEKGKSSFEKFGF